MFNIKMYNQISDKGLSVFDNNYQIKSDTTQAHGIILRSHQLKEEEIPSSVLAIGRAGAGVNNIPVDSLSERGVVVFNTPGANANAVKELVIAAMLIAARNLAPALNFIQSLDEKITVTDFDKHVESQKKLFKGFELPGKTLGVIGLGAIGVKVANSAQALGMNVIGFDPSITVQRAWELSANVTQAENIEQVLKQSDFISLHIPLLDTTKNFIGKDELDKINSNAILLNFSRAGIIDQAALLNALDENKLAGYVSDFPTPENIHHQKIINLPHLGASTQEAEENCAIMMAKQLRKFFEQGTIENAVNFPTVEASSDFNFRLTVSNKNIPNMVAQISTVLAKENLNIIDFINKSKGDYAYNIIDVEHPIEQKTLDAILAIDGVLMARSITRG